MSEDDQAFSQFLFQGKSNKDMSDMWEQLSANLKRFLLQKQKELYFNFKMIDGCYKKRRFKSRDETTQMKADLSQNVSTKKWLNTELRKFSQWKKLFWVYQ